MGGKQGTNLGKFVSSSCNIPYLKENVDKVSSVGMLVKEGEQTSAWII